MPFIFLCDGWRWVWEIKMLGNVSSEEYRDLVDQYLKQFFVTMTAERVSFNEALRNVQARRDGSMVWELDRAKIYLDCLVESMKSYIENDGSPVVSMADAIEAGLEKLIRRRLEEEAPLPGQKVGHLRVIDTSPAPSDKPPTAPGA